MNPRFRKLEEIEEHQAERHDTPMSYDKGNSKDLTGNTP